MLGVGGARHLVQHGLDPLYARDEDELALLAREHGERIAALVVPGALPLERLDAVLEARRGRLPSRNRGRGRRRAAPRSARSWVRCAIAASAGWCSRPTTPSELRFAVAAALASGDALEPRRGLRVPIRLPASVRHARAHAHRRDREPLGGRRLRRAAPSRPSSGAALSLEFPIGERLLRVQAVVAHRSRGRAPGPGGGRPAWGWPSAGLSPLEARLVEGFVRERVDSFRL